MARTRLQIDGMTCGNCVRHAREVLEGVPGVEQAAVSLETASAEVEHQGADPAEMVAALAEEGYEARIVE